MQQLILRSILVQEQLQRQLWKKFFLLKSGMKKEEEERLLYASNKERKEKKYNLIWGEYHEKTIILIILKTDLL
jgi:hypothetical protein